VDVHILRNSVPSQHREQQHGSQQGPQPLHPEKAERPKGTGHKNLYLIMAMLSQWRGTFTRGTLDMAGGV
jgi:hypothetical protein